MLFLSYWGILIFILRRFTNIQARTWDLKVCFKYKYSSIDIYINMKTLKTVTPPRSPKCFYTEYELDNSEKPNSIYVINKRDYEAFVHNGELQEMYVVEYNVNNKEYFRVLEKWVNWSLTVLRSEINNDDNYSFKIEHYGAIQIEFRRNSRTSNTSFFLPIKMNERLRIKLLTYGNFSLDTIVKLKNVDTSKIYSCIYVLNQTTHTPYHECSLRKDTGEWKIELSSYLNMSKHNMVEENISVGVTGSGTNYSQELTFQKLAYLATFCAYINIGTRSIDDIEIYFKDNNRYFDILKIVMTKTLTGEEIGCANIQQTYPSKYSCKLLKSKNWVLKVISPEKHEQNFIAEIIQDMFSFYSQNLTWRHFYMYGESYIKYFNLKMYEDDEITAIIFHFLNKSLRINEISMIRNHSEYKFKTSKESNSHNYFQREFTKEEIYSNQTSSNCLPMKIVLGILAAITLFVIIICIILIVRCKMPRYNNNKNKGKVSMKEVTPTFTITHQVPDEDNYTHYTTPVFESVQISEPRILSKQTSQELYENISPKSDHPLSDVNDIESLYAQPHKNTVPQPIDNPDIEQLYAQPIKYICK